MADLPDPISRRDRQRQTRDALIFAARSVFADVGYHAASLDQIARHAGFSKGAVYSNFENKAALFLAVMDANFDLAYSEAWDPFDRVEDVVGDVAGGQLTAIVTSGGGPAYVVGAAKAQFRVTRGHPAEFSTLSDAGHLVTRVFCANCGTHLYSFSDASPGVAAGADHADRDLPAVGDQHLPEHPAHAGSVTGS